MATIAGPYFWQAQKLRVKLLADAFALWQRTDGIHLAAALAFYSVLSLAPLLIVVVAILNWSLGSDRATDYLLGQIANAVGSDTANLVGQLIASRRAAPAHHGLSALVAAGAVLVGATATFAELSHALNRIFGGEGGRAAWKRVVYGRLIAFALVLGVALLAIASLGITTVVHASLGGLPERSSWLALACDELLSFAVLATAFALVIHVLPDCPVRPRAAIGGALVAAAMFCIGKFAIGWYLARVAVGSAYGTAGALVVLMFWMYCSSAILLIGATLAKILDVRSKAMTQRPPEPLTAATKSA
jgi:membrane protein